MLVKDEADIIEYTVRHLLTQVDMVYVSDNASTDGTYELLRALELDEVSGRLSVSRDEEVGYYQAAKTTGLAQRAYADGHAWVVPCDADEFWYSPFGRVGDVLEGLPDGYPFASAGMLNHLVTAADPAAEPNPFKRMGWRLVEWNPLPKIACRTSSALAIGMGNHDAVTEARAHSGSSVTLEGQLVIRHYPWRSAEQFTRKIRNGALAYLAAPDLDESIGAHWRAFGHPDDEGFEERTRAWFEQWGYRASPHAEHEGGEVIYDPAPGA